MRQDIFWILLGMIVILGATIIAIAVMLICERREEEPMVQPALWRVELWNILHRYRVEMVFENTCILGRSSVAVLKNGYPVEMDNTISREHCMLYDQNGALLAWNLSAVNPTVLNGYRLNIPQRIAPGDRLELGNSVFLITTVDRM